MNTVDPATSLNLDDGLTESNLKITQVKVPCCELNLDDTSTLLAQKNLIDYIEIVTNGITYPGGSLVNEKIYSG